MIIVKWKDYEFNSHPDLNSVCVRATTASVRARGVTLYRTCLARVKP